MICARDGCEREATHAPKLCVPGRGYPQVEAQALKVMGGLALCRDHAKTFDFDAMLDTVNPDQGGQTLREYMEATLREHSRVPIDWARGWVLTVRLDDPEYLEFEAQRAGKLN